MHLDRLRYFLAVADAGSFSAAAEQLYTTQSAVSKQVIALEKELGTTLFDRSRRKVELTEQGQLVLPYARSITEQCGELRSQLQIHHRHEGDTLPVASIPVMGQYGITDLIGQFRREHPEVALSVGELEGSEILSALEQGRYDLAFMRIEQLSDNGYEYLPLAEDVLVALLPEDHLLAGENSISLKQLKEEPFLLLNEGTLLHRMCVDACRRSGFLPRIAYTGTRNENISELVAMGMGVSLVMERFCLHFRPSGVRWVALKEQVTSTIALVRPQKRQNTAAVDLFWKSIQSVRE